MKVINICYTTLQCLTVQLFHSPVIRQQASDSPERGFPLVCFFDCFFHFYCVINGVHSCLNSSHYKAWSTSLLSSLSPLLLVMFVKLQLSWIYSMLNSFPCCHPYRDHRGHPGNGRAARIRPEPWGSSYCFTSQSGERVLQETGVDQAGFGSPYAEGGAGLSVSLQGASRTHSAQSKLLSVPRAPERTDRQRRYWPPHSRIILSL